MYSMALILGVDAFKGYTLVQGITTVSTGERPEIPNDLPESLAELIESGWDEDPTERPPLSEIIETLKLMTIENFDEEEKIKYSKVKGATVPAANQTKEIASLK